MEPSAEALARAHLDVLLELLPGTEVEELAEHLRLLGIEAKAMRDQVGRPYWSASVKVALTAPLADSMDVSMAPSGLALEEREGLGRVLVAERAFAPGEILFSEQPLFLIPRCVCQTNGSLGPIMAELTRRHPEQRIHFDLDAICAFFSSHTSEELSVLRCLESHCTSDSYMAGALADEVASLALSNGVLLDGARSQELAWFLRIVSVNAHTIPKVRGVALFFWLSMFSHSCSPNATYSNQQLLGDGDNSIVATPRSLCHIDKGEVIAMSYLDLQMLIASRPVRQELLRVQKSFVCACRRCCAADEARALPCPSCIGGFCTPAPTMWLCKLCNSTCTSDALALDKEEKLLRFLLEFETPDEQTIYSLLTVIDEDVGGGAQAKHFFRAWMLLSLLRHLLRNSPDSSTPVQFAVKFAMVLWKFLAWVQEHAPFCLHLLAMEFGVPAVRALLSANREDEAAQLAMEFEVALAASTGFEDPDVRFLNNLIAQRRRSTLEPLGSTMIFITCTTCSAALIAARLSVHPLNSSEGLLPEQLDGRKEAIWCRRCGLMPYCSNACEAQGMSAHSAYCITAEGPVIATQ